MDGENTVLYVNSHVLSFAFFLLIGGMQSAAANQFLQEPFNAISFNSELDSKTFDGLSKPYQALLSKCLETQKSTSKLPLDSAGYLNLADIGQHLSEHFRNDGNIVDNAATHAIAKSVYKQYCGAIRDWILQQSHLSAIPIEDENWSALADAKLFIDFALFSANAAGDSLLESRVLSRYWQYHNATGQNVQAEAVIKKSLNLLLNHSYDANEYTDTILKLNTVLKRLGKYGENIKYLASAMRLQNAISKENLEILFFSAGFLNRDLGQFDIAQRYFKLSIESYKTQPNKGSVIGNCKEQYSRHLDVGKTYTQMALVARLQNKFDEAKVFLECANWFMALYEDYYKLVAQIEEARLANIDGEYSIAFNQSQVILKDIRILPMQKLDALLVSLESVLELQNTSEFETVIAKLESLFGYQNLQEPKKINEATENYPIRQIQAFRLLIEWSNKERNVDRANEFYRIAESLMHRIRNQTLVPQAWDAARYSLVDTFVKTVWLSKGRGETDIDFATRLWDVLEKFQHSQLDREKRLLSWTPDQDVGRQAYENWIAAKRALFFASAQNKQYAQRIADVAEASFYKESLLHPQQEQSTNSLSIVDIKNSLGKGQVLLRYFVSSELSFVLVVDNQSVKVKTIKNVSEFSSLFSNYDGELFNSPQGFLSNPDITSLIPKDSILSGVYNKIYVMPVGILHQIPFAALNISETTRYIPVTHYAEVVNIHSASVYFSREPRSRLAEYRSISIFGASDNPNRVYTKLQEYQNSDGVRKYPALRGVKVETESIQKNFLTENIYLGIGDAATNDFLMSEGTRNTDILHIATHGIFDPDMPGNNGLLTHDPEQGLSTLTHSELMSRPFTSKLVVISGCETMQGKLYRGSGMHSLSRGFLAQGASATIGTLWPVNDAPTVRFMTDFYRNLKQSQSPSKALMQTKRSFSRFGRYKHPRYWAGFILSEREQLMKKNGKKLAKPKVCQRKALLSFLSPKYSHQGFDTSAMH